MKLTYSEHDEVLRQAKEKDQKISNYVRSVLNLNAADVGRPKDFSKQVELTPEGKKEMRKRSMKKRKKKAAK